MADGRGAGGAGRGGGLTSALLQEQLHLLLVLLLLQRQLAVGLQALPLQRRLQPEHQPLLLLQLQLQLREGHLLLVLLLPQRHHLPRPPPGSDPGALAQGQCPPPLHRYWETTGLSRLLAELQAVIPESGVLLAVPTSNLRASGGQDFGLDEDM